MSKHKVVIVGGGYAGVKAALDLAGDNRFHITLVSDRTHMCIYPSLYKTATGSTHQISSIPLSEIFAGKAVHVLNDKAAKLDRQAKIITTTIGHTLHFDALILAVGVGTNYFGIEGLQEYSYGIKSIEEAEELKQHLHRQLTEEGHQDLNYVIVGGGPTGVELAGEIPAYIAKITQRHGLPRRRVHVDLVEAAPRLVPRMPKDVSRAITKHLRRLGVKIYTKTAVQAQTADALMINDKPIRSHTVVWTAGIANNPFFKENEFQLNRTGKVRVDHFLQAEPGVYVIGDNADTPYSGMAQTALYDGKYVALNLIRLADNKDPKPYLAKKPVYVLPAGPRWAAVLWGGFRVYGWLGWVLRRAADFIAYNDYEPWRQATKRFMAEDQPETDCSYCNDNLTNVSYRSGEI